MAQPSFNLVQRSALLEISKLRTQVQRRALRFVRDDTVDFMSQFDQKLYELLLKTQVAGHLFGIREAEKVVQKRNIKFSFDDLVDKLSNGQSTLTDSLTDAYESEAIKLSRSISRSVDRDVRNRILDLRSEPTPKIVNELKSTFDQFGLDGVKDHQLEAIVNTQLQISKAAGEWDAYSSIDDLWGFTYLTVGDNRVRETHVNMDKTSLPKDDQFWVTNWPPNGWNCRCTTVAEFDEKSERRPSGDVTPDKGFGFNPGQRFLTEYQSTTGKISIRPRSQSRSLTDRQSRALLNVDPDSKTTPVSKPLDAAIARSRLRSTQSTFVALKPDQFYLSDDLVTFPESPIAAKRLSDAVEDSIETVVKIQTKVGDAAITLDQNKILLSRQRPYSVQSVRTRKISGKKIRIITVTQE